MGLLGGVKIVAKEEVERDLRKEKKRAKKEAKKARKTGEEVSYGGWFAVQFLGLRRRRRPGSQGWTFFDGPTRRPRGLAAIAAAA
jgi:hypothetical protein